MARTAADLRGGGGRVLGVGVSVHSLPLADPSVYGYDDLRQARWRIRCHSRTSRAKLDFVDCFRLFGLGIKLFDGLPEIPACFRTSGNGNREDTGKGFLRDARITKAMLYGSKRCAVSGCLQISSEHKDPGIR